MPSTRLRFLGMFTLNYYTQLKEQFVSSVLRWNTATRLAGGCVLAVLVTAVFLTATVIWSAYKIDDREMKRQSSIVYQAIHAYTEKMTYDQKSVAVWDDAIKKVKLNFDLEWVENNIGAWLPEYFHHDQIYLIGQNGGVLYANLEGERQEITQLPPTISRLVSELREQIISGSLAEYEAEKEPLPARTAYAILDEQPAIISIVPIVSDTGKMMQPRGTEALIASVRFMNTSLVQKLGNTYQLKDPRIIRKPAMGSHELSLPIRDCWGQVMAYFAWHPTHPGKDILNEIMTVWLVGLLAVGLTVSILARSIREAYMRLAESQANAQHAALHDLMTGLPNRQYFNERMVEALEAPENPVSLLLLDLDRFKQVNDTLGHRAGDQLICELVGRLKTTLRPDDFLARVGGDEFVVIAAGDNSQGEIAALANSISEAASKPFTVQEQRATIGISIGIATSTGANGDVAEITRQADLALYRAKNAGRNRAQFFTDEMSENLRDRHVLEAELRLALETETQLDVYYQPIICARTLSVSGVEALVRWQHPRLGQVSPVSFVQIAEEGGLIDKLGYLVLRTACNRSRGWNLSTVSVNVSPLQILKSDFVDNVLAILEDANMQPGQLELEITEGTLLDQSGLAEATLERLRKEGVRIALDDFGTGYSSLSYLVTHKVDRVKIDRSFVQKMGSGSHADSVVMSIATLAHSVGLQVTAEGVETDEQVKMLKLIGCDNLQGFHFSRPVPAEQLEQLLTAGTLDDADTNAQVTQFLAGIARQP